MERFLEKQLQVPTELLDQATFPATRDDVIEHYGTHRLGRDDDAESLAEALERIDVDSFESSDDFRNVLLTSLGGDAVGRRGYTDRDPPHHASSDSMQDSF